MDKELLKVLGIIALLLVILAASVWWLVFQWEECRELGHSFWYCVKHVT